MEKNRQNTLQRYGIFSNSCAHTSNFACYCWLYKPLIYSAQCRAQYQTSEKDRTYFTAPSALPLEAIAEGKNKHGFARGAKASC